MSIIIEQLQEKLNDSDMAIRLDSLRQLMHKIDIGELPKPSIGNDVNNHIHTTYSFSPYSPTKAVWKAYNSGLATAGIMDHDSISGAKEFIEAGKIVSMATTIGVECRADFSNTLLKDKRINNPDQKSIAYVAIHGIPHNQIIRVKDFFVPYTQERNKRNLSMVNRLNQIISNCYIQLDFGKDVIPLSKSGGSITERHILYALSLKLIERLGKGQKIVDFLSTKLKLHISSNLASLLLDTENPYYPYDLLGLLKSEMIQLFYIDAKAECPDIVEVIALCQQIGAISAYAYLGDVDNSVTGDKKSQSFEDSYLDLLFEVIKGLGFNAVTYMPSRNSMTQLERLRHLCDVHQLLQISGEDINSPRQSFICKAMRNDAFLNLIDSTWALIGHERQATINSEMGMFSAQTLNKYPALDKRIAFFKEIGLKKT